MSDSDVAFLVVWAVMVVIIVVSVTTATFGRSWLSAAADIATFGRYRRRRAERTQVERWRTAWREAQERGGRPVILAGTTFAEAVAAFNANASAVQCPSRHRNAVPVEALDGETVAALCPDCGEQLGAECAPKPAPDLNGALYETLRTPAQPPALPPFTPDPRLTRRSWM